MMNQFTPEGRVQLDSTFSPYSDGAGVYHPKQAMRTHFYRQTYGIVGVPIILDATKKIGTPCRISTAVDLLGRPKQPGRRERKPHSIDCVFVWLGTIVRT